MSTLRQQILDTLLTPIPGLCHLPGISHITGVNELREMTAHCRNQLAAQRLQEELLNIDLDCIVMQSAELRDQNDLQMQIALFGSVIHDKATNAMMTTAPTPGAQTLLAQFTTLETLKQHIRTSVRPAMEKQIAQILDEAQHTQGTLTPQLDTMFRDLQQLRLLSLAERNRMMRQREHAYRLAEAYLGARRDDRAKPVDEVASAADPERHAHDVAQSDRGASVQLPSRVSEGEIDARIDEHYAKLVELQRAGDTLKRRCDEELLKHRYRIRSRSLKWAAAIPVVTAAALAIREGAAMERRYHPYQDNVERYSRVEVDPAAQGMPVYVTPYRNHLSDNDRLPVMAHAVETGVTPQHGITAARIMDIAYKSATGDPDATADLGRVVVHGNTARTSSFPFWKSSMFVERRLRDTERMLTSTGEHHVFNHSVTSDYPYAPGSRAARKERAFLVSTTCPITVPSGNETSEGDTVTDRSQHTGELSHYPRYAIQVGEATYMKRPDGGFTVGLLGGNHPYPFIVFAAPRMDKKHQLMGHDATMGAPMAGDRSGQILVGSSVTAPGYGGNLAAQKSLFPQLSWDNIIYASALGTSKRFLGVDAAAAFRAYTPHTDISMSEEAGFGLIDPALVEQILHNMLYQRTLHPEIKDQPQVILRDAIESGPARTEHRVTLPADKDVFKVTYDFVPPPGAVGAVVTITDQHHNAKRIRIPDGQAVSRFTDWSYLGTPGSTYTITSTVPIRLGYVAHVNNRGAITLGLRHLGQLLSVDEIKQAINRDTYRDLPVIMPATPAVIGMDGQAPAPSASLDMREKRIQENTRDSETPFYEDENRRFQYRAGKSRAAPRDKC